MITETIVLDRGDDSWRSIVNTTGMMTLAGGTGPIRFRFGITSTSEGILLAPGDTLATEETIYIQPTKQALRENKFVTLYVNRA